MGCSLALVTGSCVPTGTWPRVQGLGIYRNDVLRGGSLGILKKRVGILEGVPRRFDHALLPGREPEFATIWARQMMIYHLC